MHATVPLSVLATATDPDIPTNALTFVILSGLAGLSVGTGGLIAWIPGSRRRHHERHSNPLVDDGSSQHERNAGIRCARGLMAYTVPAMDQRQRRGPVLERDPGYQLSIA